MMTLLVAVIVLLSVTLIALVVGVLIISRRLGEVSAEMTQTMKAVRENVIPAVHDASRTLNNVDLLVSEVRNEVRQIGRVIETVDRLLEGRTVVAAASRAVESSKSTLISVVEGLKETLKSMRSSKRESKNSKEESNNE